MRTAVLSAICLAFTLPNFAATSVATNQKHNTVTISKRDIGDNDGDKTKPVNPPTAPPTQTHP